MIPFNFRDPHVKWHHIWRMQIWRAKQSKHESGMYCRAAAIAQAQYVLWLALEKVSSSR